MNPDTVCPERSDSRLLIPFEAKMEAALNRKPDRSPDALSVLNSVFGLPAFRGEQRSLESWPICATARGDRFRPYELSCGPARAFFSRFVMGF